jgi:hypothetical protein
MFRGIAKATSDPGVAFEVRHPAGGHHCRAVTWRARISRLKLRGSIRAVETPAASDINFHWCSRQRGEMPMKTAVKLKAGKTTKRPAPKRPPTLVAVDALLDEALDATFPASDPVALTQPSRQRRAALKKRSGRRAR